MACSFDDECFYARQHHAEKRMIVLRFCGLFRYSKLKLGHALFLKTKADARFKDAGH